MSVRWLIGGLIAVVGSAGGILPWVVGDVAQQTQENLLRDLPNRGVEVVAHDYERGWFGSRSTTELILPANQGPLALPAAEALILHNEVTHTPWSLSRPNLLPAAGFVDTLIEFVNAEASIPPLEATTRIELDGSGVTRLDMPAHNWGTGREGAVQTGQGRGEIRFGPRLESVDTRLGVPTVVIEGAGNRGVLGLGGVRAENTTRLRADGEFETTGTFSLDRMAVRAPDMELSGSGIRLRVLSEPQGELLAMSIQIEIDSLEANGEAYAPSEVVIAAERLPVAEIQALGAATQGMGAAEDEWAQIGMGLTLMSHVPRILAPAPRVRIDRLDLTTPAGPVSGRLSLGLDPASQPAGNVRWPPPGLERLSGEAQLALPSSLLLQLLAYWETVQPTSAYGTAAERARVRVAEWVDGGWLIDDGERVRASAHLAGLRLSVNDRTVTLSPSRLF